MTAVPYVESDETLGLEDVDASDLAVPRISIVGKKAMFKHSTTNEEFPKLTAVLLAQVKSRIMWHKDIDQNYSQPQCRSNDFVNGFPNIDPKAPSGRAFPWAESNFDPTAGPTGAYNPPLLEETGLPSLPCDKCVFKDWKDKKTLCKEQHVYPLMYLDEDDIWSPAILTIQGAGIKASKTYVGGFATIKLPLFTAVTEITLTPASRGQVDYAIPSFRKTGPSDAAHHEEYQAQVRMMREYLRRPPYKREEVDNSAAAQASANINAAPTPVVIEHVPVTPPPTPAPAPSVAAPAPAAPVAPAPTPTVAAPSLAPPVQAPIAAPEPAPVPAAAVADPVEVIPAGYEAMWSTLPQAAKDAILAQAAATPAPVAAEPAPVAEPAIVAPSGSDDLPF